MTGKIHKENLEKVLPVVAIDALSVLVRSGHTLVECEDPAVRRPEQIDPLRLIPVGCQEHRRAEVRSGFDACDGYTVVANTRDRVP